LGENFEGGDARLYLMRWRAAEQLDADQLTALSVKASLIDSDARRLRAMTNARGVRPVSARRLSGKPC
jgi:hypothetical protein